MTKRTAIDEMDDMTHEFARSLVADVEAIKKEIGHPAMSVKLTRQELWAKYGKDYPTLREDENAWKQTIDQMGEKDALEFGREMELAFGEFGMGGE